MNKPDAGDALDRGWAGPASRGRGTGFAGPQAPGSETLPFCMPSQPALQAGSRGTQPPRGAESHTKWANVGANTLWLVRHAQPLIAPGVCYGQLDVPADLEANRVCAETLAKVLPYGIDIISSPLQRCEQLAQALFGLRADLAYKIDLRLKEMNFGQWEGQRWDDIGAADMDAWVGDFANHRPGGGESVCRFMHRVAAAWDAAHSQPDTLWITHAGVIRAAMLLHSGQREILHASQWPADAPAFGAWIRLSMP